MGKDHFTQSCQNCGGELKVDKLSCCRCHLTVEGRIDLPRLARLNAEEREFIELFVLSAGSLKEVGKVLNLSYPTVRAKLDRVIESLQGLDKERQAARMAILEQLKRCAGWGATEYILDFPGSNPVARNREKAAREEIDRRGFRVVAAPERGKKTAVLGNTLLLRGLPDSYELCGGFFDALDQRMMKKFRRLIICRQNFSVIAAKAAELLRAMMEGEEVPGMTEVPPRDYLTH